MAATLVAALVVGASLPAAGQGRGGAGGAIGPARGGTPPGGQGGGRGGRGAPDRDGAAQGAAVGTGEISGIVVVLGSGSPARRAQVTLSGQELRGNRTTVTDEQGRFAFPVLPAGRFSLTVNKPGHVSVSFGAKRPGRPGTPIQLADGQKVEKLAIALPRGGVITGVVVDENGEPAPSAQVRALRYVMQTGERTLNFAGQDTTDDRGLYRIYSLQPGEYVVSAIPRNLNPATDMRQLIMSQAAALQESLGQVPAGGGRAGFVLGNLGAMAGSPGAQQAIDQLAQQLGVPEGAQTAAYAPVYYPGTATPAGATTITIGVAEERSGVDFQLQLVPTARVQGIIASQDGTLPSNIMVSLLAAGPGGIPVEPQPGSSVTRVDGSGQFTFRDITPGQYVLQARAVIRRPEADGRAAGPGRGGFGPVPPNQIAQVLWAATELSVSGRDIDDLQLVLQPGMAIGGRVDFRGSSSPAPAELSSVRLNLTPRGQQNVGPGGSPVAIVDEFGRFTITGVAPGRYTLSGAMPQSGRGGSGRGAGANTSWTLASAMVDGRDVLDFPLDVAPHENIRDAIVAFTDRTQDLSGRIQDAMGRPTADFTIIVFPTDTRYWLPRARRIMSTRPGTDGSFVFRDLPPGDYRLTAVTDVEPGEWYDPAFLAQLSPVSLPITIREGEKKVQDIRVAN